VISVSLQGLPLEHVRVAVDWYGKVQSLQQAAAPEQHAAALPSSSANHRQQDAALADFDAANSAGKAAHSQVAALDGLFRRVAAVPVSGTAGFTKASPAQAPAFQLGRLQWSSSDPGRFEVLQTSTAQPTSQAIDERPSRRSDAQQRSAAAPSAVNGQAHTNSAPASSESMQRWQGWRLSNDAAGSSSARQDTGMHDVGGWEFAQAGMAAGTRTCEQEVASQPDHGINGAASNGAERHAGNASASQRDDAAPLGRRHSAAEVSPGVYESTHTSQPSLPEQLASVSEVLRHIVERIAVAEETVSATVDVAAGQMPGPKFLACSSVYTLQVRLSKGQVLYFSQYGASRAMCMCAHKLLGRCMWSHVPDACPACLLQVLAVQLVDASGRASYYVGESDAVVKRLQTHRKAMPRRCRSEVAAAVVVGLPASEKSTAKLIERDLQQALFQKVSCRCTAADPAPAWPGVCQGCLHKPSSVCR
jgi:predicted GIY-YIG superfamily endonuclease